MTHQTNSWYARSEKNLQLRGLYLQTFGPGTCATKGKQSSVARTHSYQKTWLPMTQHCFMRHENYERRGNHGDMDQQMYSFCEDRAKFHPWAVTSSDSLKRLLQIAKGSSLSFYDAIDAEDDSFTGFTSTEVEAAEEKKCWYKKATAGTS